jgi:hypothetical protein
MAQTAVEWYAQALRKCLMGTVPCDPIQILEQANQMFKEQITYAYNNGVDDAYADEYKAMDDYYNERYGK